MTDHPAAPTGAQREKLHSIPYDLVPFQEMTDAYVRAAEYGAKKYTQHWNTECQGLLNVPNVVKIEITLPATSVESAIKKASALQSINPKRRKSESALCAAGKGQSTSSALKSAALVITRENAQPTLNITLDGKPFLEDTIEKIKSIGRSKHETDALIQFLESVISEPSFSSILQIWESRKQSISNTTPKDAQSAEPLLIFTLTTITGRVFSEAFFARAATTVSDFWVTISRALSEHSLIYGNDVRVKRTGCWNHTLGIPRVQIISSLLRHTWAYLRGEERDKDSGLLHTDHILWNAAALAHNVHWDLADGRRVEPPREYKTKGENVLPPNPVQHSVE